MWHMSDVISHMIFLEIFGIFDPKLHPEDDVLAKK